MASLDWLWQPTTAASQQCTCYSHAALHQTCATGKDAVPLRLQLLQDTIPLLDCCCELLRPERPLALRWRHLRLPLLLHQQMQQPLLARQLLSAGLPWALGRLLQDRAPDCRHGALHCRRLEPAAWMRHLLPLLQQLLLALPPRHCLAAVRE